MSGEEPGLLGKLPRSRPGRRSAKRPPVRAAAPSDAEPPPERRVGAAGDPVGDAVRTATRAAGAGLRAADGLTRELLRRLPRR